MENIKEIVDNLSEKHGQSPESLLPILQGIVNKRHYISEDAIREVARVLNISTAKVFGTASFYSFLDIKPRGKYVIRLCKTITCNMHGSHMIRSTIENMLKIKLGDTTLNKKFTLLETNCLGWCHKGPAMLVNDKSYTELTPEKIRAILTAYLNDEIEE